MSGLEAAVDAGADMVEFDVAEGLVLEHPGGESTAVRPTLDDALAYLAREAIGVHVDLKHEGSAAAVRRHDLGGRVMSPSRGRGRCGGSKTQIRP